MRDDTWSDPQPETVVPGVHRLPLPLPGDALKAVNVYVLEGDDGLTLIDSGWDSPPSRRALDAGLAWLGAAVADIRRVLVTHVHVDHVGQATVIKRASSAQVWLGPRERASFRAAIDRSLGADERRARVMRRAGGDELTAQMAGGDEPRVFDWDGPTHWTEDGAVIPTGSGTLQAVATPGHTQGHTSFVDHDRRLFFPGDHVLPHITPSIGFEAYLSETALGDFLSSLARVRDLAVDRVLPAHGPVFSDLAGRVDELVAHHGQRLDECAGLLSAQGTTAYEAAHGIGWTRRKRPFTALDLFNRLLATWETLAHFDLLVAQGRARCSEDEGVWRFHTVDASDP